MIIISGHFWLVVQAKNVNSSGTFIRGSPYCEQCPLPNGQRVPDSRTLPDICFDTSTNSVLKIIEYQVTQKFGCTQHFGWTQNIETRPIFKKKLPVGPCLWEKRPGHRLSWTGRLWTWTTIDLLSALSTSELKSCLLCDHRSICQPHELMKIRKFGNGFYLSGHLFART